MCQQSRPTRTCWESGVPALGPLAPHRGGGGDPRGYWLHGCRGWHPEKRALAVLAPAGLAVPHPLLMPVSGGHKQTGHRPRSPLLGFCSKQWWNSSGPTAHRPPNNPRASHFLVNLGHQPHTVIACSSDLVCTLSRPQVVSCWLFLLITVRFHPPLPLLLRASSLPVSPSWPNHSAGLPLPYPVHWVQ